MLTVLYLFNKFSGIRTGTLLPCYLPSILVFALRLSSILSKNAVHARVAVVVATTATAATTVAGGGVLCFAPKRLCVHGTVHALNVLHTSQQRLGTGDSIVLSGSSVMLHQVMHTQAAPCTRTLWVAASALLGQALHQP